MFLLVLDRWYIPIPSLRLVYFFYLLYARFPIYLLYYFKFNLKVPYKNLLFYGILTNPLFFLVQLCHQILIKLLNLLLVLCQSSIIFNAKNLYNLVSNTFVWFQIGNNELFVISSPYFWKKIQVDVLQWWIPSYVTGAGFAFFFITLCFCSLGFLGMTKSTLFSYFRCKC